MPIFRPLYSPNPTHLRLLRSRLPLTLSSVLAISSLSSMGTSQSGQWHVEKYTPKSSKWPFGPLDFSRQDESPDSTFYATPKYVTHIDDNAIENLARYYDDVLPAKGRILDFCSSWTSHYPSRLQSEPAVEVYGTGLNAAELQRNSLFGGATEPGRRKVQDLNASPDLALAFPGVKFAASTCTVSVDYLSKPLEVLTSLRAVTEEGGTVHLAISNRAFWHKVVRRWMLVGERERLEMVGDYLWFAGWREVEIVTVVAGGVEGGGGYGGWIGGMFGGGGGDPLWVVRGRNIKTAVREAL